MLYEEKIIDTIPVGPLGLIPLKRAGERAQVYDCLCRLPERFLYYFRQHAEIRIRRGKGRFKRVCPRR